MSHARREWLYVVALASALLGGCRCGSKLPATNADGTAVTPNAPAVTGEPTQVLESRGTVAYPESVALRGGAPPIRPAAAVALPPDNPAEPTPRIAVSGWGVGSSEPLLQLIDIDEGAVLWSESGVCRGDVRSATSQHLVCSAPDGGTGIDAVDAASGARLWSSSLVHVTSGEGVVVATDKEGIALLDVATGEPLVRLRAPVELAGELRRVCRDTGSKEVTLVGWSDTGTVVVYDVGDDGSVERRWDMQLPGPVLRDHVCQGGIMLFSFRRAGDKWWARYSAKDGRFIAESPTGVDRVGLETSDFRVVDRMPDGTLELADIYRGRIALGAPVGARQLFVGKSSLAAVGRSDGPNAADRVKVYRLPAVQPGSSVPAPAATPTPTPAPAPSTSPTPPVEPAPSATPTPAVEPAPPAPQALPEVQSFTATAVHPDGGGLSPAAVSLVGDVLWLVVHRGPSAPDAVERDAVDSNEVEREIVSFALDTRAYGIRDADLCPERGRGIAVAVSGDSYACATREVGAGRGFLRGRATPGASPWALGFSTLHDVRVAGRHYVAVAGPVAVIIKPDTGQTVYRVTADNGFAPRFVGLGDLILHVDPGRLVARDPARGGAAVWHIAFQGYPVAIAEVGDRVAVAFRDGSVASIAADGRVRRLEASGSFRGAAGALWFDGAAARNSAGTPAMPVRARAPDGAIRFETHLPIEPDGASFGRRPAGASAPVVVETAGADRRLIVLEPEAGRVLGAVRLPAGAAGTSFSSRNLAGAVTGRPLAVHTWAVPDAPSD